MGKSIKVLIVEDSEDDADLLICALQRGGYDPAYEIVETPEAMSDALDRQSWDLVISDYSMPCFSGLDALKLLKEKDPDLSFILLTGQVGEEVAVEAMQAGANDYILKSNRARLIPAVERELRDTQARCKNRQNEQALRESRENYRLIVETANEGIWQIDEEDRVIFVNQKMVEMIGYSIEEIVGQTPYAFMDEEWSTSTKANIRRRRQGIRVQFEYKLQRKDGTALWVIVNSFPIFRDDGSYAGMIGMHSDITERKLAEKELRKSEERFRLLFDGSQDAIMTLAPPSWKFTSANLAALKMIGAKDATEFTALGPWDASPERQPDGRPSADKAKEMIETTLREGSHFFEWTHRRLDGADFPANVLFTRVEIAGQVFLQATVRDITAQKQADDALRESEEKHRHLIENSHDIIYTLTLDGVFTFVSPAWTTLIGHPVTQVVGQPFQPFVHADDVAVCMDYLQTVIRTGQRQANVEYRVRHVDGSWRWNTTNGVPLRDNAGTIIGFEGIARDITERKRSENALKESKEKLSALYASMAEGLVIHEIVYDSSGKPIDYVITDVNPAYEKLLGLKKVESVGKRASVLYGAGEPPYLDIYARVASTREPASFETYFPPMEKHFSISVFSPAERMFATVFRDVTENKHAEQALRESREQYRLIVETANEGIWQVDEENRTTFVNQKMAGMLGYTVEEIMGQTIYTFMDEEWGKIAAGNIHRRQSIEGQVECKFQRKDGKDLWTIVNSSPIFRDDGSYAGSIGMLNNITERRQAEQELVLRALLLDSANDSIIMNDFEGRLHYFNEVACRFHGYAREEMMQKNVFELIAPESAEDHQFRVNELKTNGRCVYEAIDCNKDGGRFPVEVNSRVIDIEGRQFVLSVSRDITERKQAEEALQESETKYRTIFETTGTAMAIIEEDTTISLVNQEFMTLSGYAKEEIEGRKGLLEFISPNNLELCRKYHHLRRVDPGAAPRNYEVEFINRQGDHRNVLLIVDIIPGTKKSVESFLDITEHKRAEERLKYLSFHDNSTGIYNRSFFDEELRRLDVARQLPLSIIMGDVNGLKLVNDTLGHQAGDGLIATVAAIIQGSCRSEDIICRWGGDEFAVLLTQTDRKTAEEICDRIRMTCEEASVGPVPVRHR